MLHQGNKIGVTVSEEQIDELVSGFLDGELDVEEQKQFEQLLSSDSRIAHKLQQLRTIRRSLVSLPARRLPQSFADRVIAEAKQRATSDNSQPIPRHIQLAIANDSADVERSQISPAKVDEASKSEATRSGAFWKLGFALAASVALMIVSWKLIENTQNSNAPGVNTLVGSTQSGNPKNSQATPDIAEPDANSNVPPVSNIAGVESPSSVISPEAGSPPVPGDSALEVQPENGSSLAIAGSEDSSKTPGTDSAVAANESSSEKPMNANSDAESIKNFASAQGNPLNVNLLMVVDLVVTKDAWERRDFSRLLNEYGILSERPIVANDDLQKSLASSRLVSPPSENNPSDKPAEEIESVQLVFVQAKAKPMDELMIHLFQDVSNFERVYFDLAMDPPSQDVLKRLSSSTPAIDQQTGVAQSIDWRDQDGSSFVGLNPRGNELNLEARKAMKAGIVSSSQFNPVVQVLFVLRQPKGTTGGRP